MQVLTIGDHIKRQRLKLRLFQHELAAILGVQTCAIERWERNHTAPHHTVIRRVIRWLGYDPGEVDTDILV